MYQKDKLSVQGLLGHIKALLDGVIVGMYIVWRMPNMVDIYNGKISGMSNRHVKYHVNFEFE